MKSLYDILGIPRDADAAAVRRAYRALSLKLHPDKCPGDKRAAVRYKKIQDAYEVLGDELRRAHYDATGQARGAADNSMTFISEAVSPILQGLIVALADQGVSAANLDLADALRKGLAQNLCEVNKEQLSHQKMRATLEEAIKRFTVDDGENLLESLAKSHLERVERALESLDSQAKKIKLAQKFLERVRYRYEPVIRYAALTSATSGLWG